MVSYSKGDSCSLFGLIVYLDLYILNQHHELENTQRGVLYSLINISQTDVKYYYYYYFQ